MVAACGPELARRQQEGPRWWQRVGQNWPGGSRRGPDGGSVWARTGPEAAGGAQMVAACGPELVLGRGTRLFVACNHQRSYQYYSDSILNRSGFTGYPCNDFSTFESGSCFPCSEGECPVMGHFADTFKIPDGVSKMRYFMSTGKNAPFVRYRYHVNVTIDGTRTNPGYFKVALYGASDNTRQYRIFIGFLKPGGSYDVFVDTERDVGEVTHVKFVWNNNIINPMLPRFGATRIQVLRGRDSRTFEFCGQEKVLENVLQTLSPCGSP
ncbi:inactive pancreatic lipase-related protein 1-like [Alosa pseudoharengus]|uniref:inactive pancreatic lipase-related protein 1-like n=1 Tax=Alosa pseudoharengus TaxID=34774 RepID=UPI003F891510